MSGRVNGGVSCETQKELHVWAPYSLDFSFASVALL